MDSNEDNKLFKFSELSRNLTSQINNAEKKNNGIFFTPPKTVLKNIKFLEPYMKNIKNILEPSCGSCEYILKLNNINDDIHITGMELNKTIFDSIKQYEGENITLINDNYLTYKFNNNFSTQI